MKKRVPDKFWFPWWPDKWIFGSVRIEFTPAERGIWVDMLSLASKDDGHIRANEETPYPLQQLSGMLIIPEKELDAAIKKFIKNKKLTMLKSGTLYVTKWDKYQFSERHKRRVVDEIKKAMSAETDMVSKKKDAIIYNNKLNNNKLNNSKEEQKPNITFAEEVEITTELKTIKGIGEKKHNEIILYLRELSIEFPDLDYVYQMKKKCAWWLDNPLNKKSNIHLQLRNWFIIAQKGFTEARKQQRVGKDADADGHREKFPMLFLSNVYAALRKQGKDNAEYSDKLFSLSDEEAKVFAEKYKDSVPDFIKFLEDKK